MARWNEISKKTLGILIVMGVLLAGFTLVLVFALVRARGGEEIAEIVADSIRSQRVTTSSEGDTVVSDRLIITFRTDLSEKEREKAASETGVAIEGRVSNAPGAFVVAFEKLNGLQLRQLMGRISQHPDVIDVSLIPVE